MNNGTSAGIFDGLHPLLASDQDTVTSSLNTGSCLNGTHYETLQKGSVIAILVILGVINFAVIGGNLLVIASIFVSTKLRTVTNFFIVSLAVADLCLGLVVLPYSISLEVLKIWIFGDIWCQIWLAVDVWMCTSSILNLCAISVDRYLAITRPVHYRSLMSSSRAKLLIAGVWVFSFIICFPPLVGWNDQGKPPTLLDPAADLNLSFFENNSFSSLSDSGRAASSSPSGASTLLINFDIALTNETEEETGDMGVLSRFFAAYDAQDDANFAGPGGSSVSSSVSSNSGIKSIVISGEETTSQKPWAPSVVPVDAATGTTNIDGGGGGSNETSQEQQQPSCDCTLINNKGYVIYSALGSFYIPMFVMLFFYWRIYLAALRTSRALERGFLTTKGSSGSGGAGSGSQDKQNSDLTLRMHRGKSAESNSNEAHRHSGDIIIPRKKAPSSSQVGARGGGRSGGSVSGGPGGGGGGLQRAGAKKYIHFTAYHSGGGGSSSSSGVGGNSKSSLTSNGIKNSLLEGEGRGVRADSRAAAVRLSKRNIRWHARRFHSEAKATKTVGIIVGGFVCCWLPFFTVYLTRAFCEDCIPELLFSIFFWLGYCNSAINPLIYGLFSKDFRQAFKRILCRCFVKDEGISSLIKQIHLPTFFEENNLEEPPCPLPCSLP